MRDSQHLRFVSTAVAAFVTGWAFGCARVPNDEPETVAHHEPNVDAEAPGDRAPAPQTCIRRLQIDSHASVLEEQRRIGPHRDDFQREFDSIYVDPDTYTPVEATKKILVGGTPFFWWPPDKDQAVVHGAIAGALHSKDAFVLEPKERFELGALNDLVVGKIEGLDVFEALVRAGVIQTFAHLEATLCVTEQSGDLETGYRAVVDGKHVYYTNEANEDAYRFVFEISPALKMSLEGL